MRTLFRTRLIASATMAAVLTLAVGCGSPVSTGEPSPAGTPRGPSETGGAAGPDSPGSDDDHDTSQEPGGEPTKQPAEAAEVERVVLLPVDLVAPPQCFTEGLDKRYVDGRGTQTLDPGPHADLVATTVRHQGATRLQMDRTQRRVHLLPGSGGAVEAPAGGWTVNVEVHMFLSGGFQIDYTRTHRGETGAFHRTFHSPVDDSCTVEIVYGITTGS